jgi:hypothetical protein
MLLKLLIPVSLSTRLLAKHSNRKPAPNSRALLSFWPLHFWLKLTLLLPLLLLTACGRLTTVQNVREHPQRNWFTQTVRLQGTVGDRAPLLQGQVYELQDKTGKIWVLSPKANLQTGTAVLIQGEVRYEAIQVEDQNLGEVYIEEQQQMPPSP